MRCLHRHHVAIPSSLLPMQASQHWSVLKRGLRDLLAKGIERRGYELVPANRASASKEKAHVELESIPIGRTEPFSTAHYDVLPRDLFDVVPHNYYSPIPDLSGLPKDVWERRSDLCGVDLDPDAGIEFLERKLAPFVDEMDFQTEDPGEPGVFFLRNAAFESVDAELLYGMIRSIRPKRVLELGSGYTTLLLNMAVKRNAEEGSPAEHVAYDPYPREHVLGKSVPEPTRLEAISATDVPLAVFTELEAGDVLFVDTTHARLQAGKRRQLHIAGCAASAKGWGSRAFPRHLPALGVPASVVRGDALLLDRAVPPSSLFGFQQRIRGTGADTRYCA